MVAVLGADSYCVETRGLRSSRRISEEGASSGEDERDIGKICLRAASPGTILVSCNLVVPAPDFGSL